MNDQLRHIRRAMEEVIDTEKLKDGEKALSDYQLCFIIRPGIRGVLDVARKALHETTQDILELSRALSGKGNLEYIAILRVRCRH